MTKRRRRKCLNCRMLFRPAPAQPAAPAVLLGRPLPQGEQGGQPGALAVSTAEPELLPRTGKTYNFKPVDLIQFHAVGSI